MDLEMRLEGHAIGLAAALAERLEDAPELAFVAFKMPHPLCVHASVTMRASTRHQALGVLARACDQTCTDVDLLLSALPAEPEGDARHWPERQYEHFRLVQIGSDQSD